MDPTVFCCWVCCKDPPSYHLITQVVVGAVDPPSYHLITQVVVGVVEMQFNELVRYNTVSKACAVARADDEGRCRGSLH